VKNAELIDDITQDDVLELFRTRVDPASPRRAKLSVHLRAQKAPAAKVSGAALDAFDELLSQTGLRLEDAHSNWRAETSTDEDSEPLESAVLEHWRARLAALPDVPADTRDTLLAALPRLVREHPTESAYEGTLPAGAVVIEDPKAFKASLAVAAGPRPLVDWADLPTPKL
jgi:insulysin